MLNNKLININLQEKLIISTKIKLINLISNHTENITKTLITSIPIEMESILIIGEVKTVLRVVGIEMVKETLAQTANIRTAETEDGVTVNHLKHNKTLKHHGVIHVVNLTKEELSPFTQVRDMLVKTIVHRSIELLGITNIVPDKIRGDQTISSTIKSHLS